MKIKRFFAPDIRSAMKMVKEELGADAVIMSNRSVDGGVEIVAARDFDEQVIHNKLNKGSETTEKVRKKADLPNFDDANRPMHVISSSRKKGVDGSIPENPIRRNMDQYLGYAEKIQVANAQQHSQKIAEKLQSKVSKPIPDPAVFVQESRENAAMASKNQSIEQIMQEVRNEMRREISSMKAAMDARLAEVGRRSEFDSQPTRLDLLRKLAEMGFSKRLSVKIANRLGNHKNIELAFDKAQEMLAKILPVAKERALEQGGIVALVGPTGVGKTTTIAKIAAQFILKYGSGQVGLITTDNFRIGAHEQLKIYGRILDVPVKIANNAEELYRNIQQFSDKRLVLIDTAGMSQRDMRLVEQIQILYQYELPIKTYLVLSAATQYKAVHETIAAFGDYQPQAGILTKMDEAVSPGGALSAVIEHQLPLVFMTDGQQVPEDIHVPEAMSLIRRCGTGIEHKNDYTNSLNDEDWVAESYA